MIYLTLPELIRVAERASGGPVAVRDAGLLEAAAARPAATAFGADAYPDLPAKAAALVHSLARYHALADGNKRLALAALIAFTGMNGHRLALTSEAACELITQIADGELNHVGAIASRLADPEPDRF